MAMKLIKTFAMLGLVLAIGTSSCAIKYGRNQSATDNVAQQIVSGWKSRSEIEMHIYELLKQKRYGEATKTLRYYLTFDFEQGKAYLNALEEQKIISEKLSDKLKKEIREQTRDIERVIKEN